ncbi:hypothetical protein WB388_32230 [Streptomyces brasiliscabiei]|uniref:Uncharacterized protein n=1 Tax=Streptomyces brasiliscabiei TaxID=2736302 RepID=A0ABU8GG73_9ACTN
MTYLVAANEARRAFVTLRGVLQAERFDEALLRAAIDAFPQAVQSLRPSSMTVMLEGPARVADAARSFTQVFVQIWEYVEPSLINADTSAREQFLHRATEALTALTEAERTFIAAAQSVLDDDGTAPGPGV